MIWARMRCQPSEVGAWMLSWFRHGRSGNGMQLQLGRHHGLGMDALVIQRGRGKRRQWTLAFGSHRCLNASASDPAQNELSIRSHVPA